MTKCLRRVAIFVWLLVSLTPTTRGTETGDEHLVMGNPSSATTDINNTTNYLMRKIEYVLSYNKDTACPNWVSWHLNASWLGSTDRLNNFRPDSDLPNGWLRVKPNDYSGTGFDQGHMCNSKDRSKDKPSNSATFLMTNMVPQSPRNNEVTWKGLEAFCQTLAKDHELYIVCGPAGRGGEGYIKKTKKLVNANELEADRNDGTSETINVPAETWKVVMVLPAGKESPHDVSADTTTIAVIMPNNQTIDTDWKAYTKTVNDVETLTGYHFFTTVDPQVAKEIKSHTFQGP